MYNAGEDEAVRVYTSDRLLFEKKNDESVVQRNIISSDWQVQKTNANWQVQKNECKTGLLLFPELQVQAFFLSTI